MHSLEQYRYLPFQWYSPSFGASPAELEDPTKHGWFAERIQPDWLTEDVDEYFKLGPEHWGEPTSSAKEMGVMMVLFV